MTEDIVPTKLRWPAVAALFVAAGAHVPVIPEHLREAPYMGVLFVGFTAVAVALALLLAVRGAAPMPFAMAGLLCAAAIVAYCLTRLVAFPQLADDVGNWGEPAGVVSIASESVVVALCAAAASRAAAVAGRTRRYGGRSRRTRASS